MDSRFARVPAGLRLLPLLLILPVCLAWTQADDQEGARSSAELVEDGRRLLEDGRAVEAEPLFIEAAGRAGQDAGLSSRMWILRAWMDRGRSNETLDELDALARAGESGPTMDYLYGMAFVRRAEDHIAAGVTDSSIKMNFEDGVELLSRALAAEPDGFRDAYEELARACWFGRDLERARVAGEQAVAVLPESRSAWLMLGRVAMSQFVSAQGSSAWSEEALGHWSTANHAFAQALHAPGRSGGPGDPALLAEAATQLGHSLVWKGLRREAADAYALAMAWTPDTFDYGSITGTLTPPADSQVPPHTNLGRALESASARYRAMHGSADPRDATLLWWLGWSQRMNGRNAEAEKTFLAALEKVPTYVNAWFHIALIRYDAGDWPGVLDAMRHGWELDPAVIVAEMSTAPELNVEKLDYVLGQIYAADDMSDCALLAEICAETAREDARLWNNLGLFLRKQADRAGFVDPFEGGSPEVWEPQPDADPDKLRRLHERAFVAYSKALALSPDDPQLLNDTAVLLHYYLDDQLETALKMYARSAELAGLALADTDLTEEDRQRFEKARGEALNNVERLELRIEGRADAPAELPIGAGN